MPTGKVIFLNGSSSSGKTTILRTLQGLLEEPYLEAGIDKFIWMLPARYLDRPLWDEVLGRADRAGKTGHDLVHGMHQAIAALARSGCNVLADHVLVERDWAQECALLFHSLPAWSIGIRCPLAELEKREAGRRDRTLGQARRQHALVHRHVRYDLEVDSAHLDPEQCARAILSRLEAPPQAFTRMHSAGML